MDRRDFLKAGAALALSGPAVLSAAPLSSPVLITAAQGEPLRSQILAERMRGLIWTRSDGTAEVWALREKERMADWLALLSVFSMQRNVAPVIKETQWAFLESGGSPRLLLTGEYAEFLSKTTEPFMPDHVLAHGIWQAEIDNENLKAKTDAICHLIPSGAQFMAVPGGEDRCALMTFEPVDWSRTLFNPETGWTVSL